MNINLTANWRLIRTLEPLLKLSDAGRAVLVSSGAAHKCRAYWGPYSVSKAGLEALGKTWAAELASTPVKVNLLNPGPVRTGMRAKAFPGEDPNTLAQPADLAPLFLDLADPAQAASGQLFDFPAWQAARS
jgi:NAD(P)-dependent dehydrogenase (short-subunit alcohol dehydrogenase family)